MTGTALEYKTIVIRNGKIVWKHEPHLAEFLYQRYTDADLKICQYHRLHVKTIC